MSVDWSVIRREDTPLEGFALEAWLGDGCSIIAGVDEVGRGCLAGPVFAAAVVLQGDASLWADLDDSKRLSKKRRESLYEAILEHAAAVSVGEASVSEVDELNILHASRLAMARALEKLPVPTDCVLADGTFAPTYLPDGARRVVAVVDGDARCPSISAASIVAKVERDRYMASLDEIYPAYEFAQNAGYGTSAHREALRLYGPSPVHRSSFAPVAAFLQTRLMIDG